MVNRYMRDRSVRRGGGWDGAGLVVTPVHKFLMLKVLYRSISGATM